MTMRRPLLVLPTNSLHLLLLFLVMMVLSWPYAHATTPSTLQTDPNVTTNTHDSSKKPLPVLTLPLYSTDTISLPRHYQRRRRRRRINHQSPHNVQSINLLQGYGTHFVQLYIGHPTPQPQTFIVDTGSEATAMPCRPCPNCGAKHHIHPYWDPRRTTSYETVRCGSCRVGHCQEQEEEEDGNASETGNGRREEECVMKHAYEEGTHWFAVEGEDWAYLVNPVEEGEELRIPKETKKNATTSLLRGRGKEQENGTLLLNSSVEGINHKTEMDMQFQASVEKRTRDYENHGKFRLLFGCMYELTGAFRTQLANGIAGFERSEDSLWYQMYKGNAIQQKQFSLCFQQPTVPHLPGKPAGVIVLGGTDEKLNQEQMVYAQLVTDGPWFTIYVEAIYLELVTKKSDGSKVTRIEQLQGMNMTQFNEGEIIIDSGSTDNYLPNTMRKPLENAWQALMGKRYNASKVYSADESYPNMVFQLKAAKVLDKEGAQVGSAAAFDADRPNDVIIRMPPENFMIEEEGGYSSLYMDDNPEEGGILGAQAMKGKNILFDDDNSRVGFATSKCQVST